MDIEAALTKAGGFGCFQIKITFVSILYSLYSAFPMLGNVFLGAVPREFVCTNPKSSNGADLNVCKKSCKNYYVTDGTRSFTVEWNLLCESQHLVTLSHSILMFGILLGALFFGSYADKVGRRRGILISLIGQLVTSVASTMAPEIYLYLCSRFALGFFTQGVMLCSFTLLMELTPSGHRAWVGVLVQGIYALGICLLALLAFLLPYWRLLASLIALLSLVCLPSWCLLVESPSWLVTRGRASEANRTLQDIARTNGVAEPVVISGLTAATNEVKWTGTDHFSNIILHPQLRWLTAITLFCWFVNSLVYYGLTFAAGNSTSSDHFNKYLSFALSGVAELPGYIFLPWMINK